MPLAVASTVDLMTAKSELHALGLRLLPDVAEIVSRAVAMESVGLPEVLALQDLVDVSGETPSVPLYAMLLGLLGVRRRGSLCLPLDRVELIAEIEAFSAEAENLADEIVACLAAGNWSQLVATGEEPFRPVVLSVDGQFLYFRKYFQCETRLRERLAALARGQGHVVARDDTVLRDMVRECAAFRGFSLNAAQMWGVYLALRGNFAVVTGGPGTGKTTLVASLLRALDRFGVRPDRIALVAPTGRAAQRLTESLRQGLARAEEPPERRERLETLEGTTIHRLLHFQVQRGAFAYDEDYPVPVDAVIVDEVSMVDVSLMERLLAAVRRDALVVFLGDKNQLPSVEAGAVLAELIPSVGRYGFSPAVAAELAALTPGEEIPRASADSLLADRVVVLEQSNRVAGAVYHVAQRMNAGDVSVVDDLPSLPAGPLMAWPTDEPSCVRLSGPLGDSRLLQDTVESWVERHWVAPRGEPLLRELLSAAQAAVDRTDPEEEVPLRALLDRYSRGCILAALRRGAHGVEGLNQMLAGWLRRRLEPSAARTSLFAGAPVLVTRNTPGMGLFNGDHGVAVRRPDGRLVVLFRRGGEVLRVPASLLPPHELAFALTVHKSQGSEYDNVLLVLPSTGAHQLLTREIVYTAITRSRGMVAIWSFPQVLAEAVLRRIRRSSALGLWPEPEP